MTQLGCDVDEMARLEALLGEHARLYDEIAIRVDSALGRLVWNGADADGYRSSWRSRGRAALTNASSLLTRSAGEVKRNRLEQLAASGAAGAGAPLAPTSLPSGPGPSPTSPGGWAQQAADHAGIDLAAWNPALGADANAANIEAVYRYYGQLFLDHPELQWAGMANMIGPSFAAGFFDLATLRSAAGTVAGVLDKIPAPLRPIDAEAMRALASMSEADLRFYETTFLTMQREIFLDQATVHEAYLSGGLPAIEQLRAAGAIDDAAVQAWRDIDAGVRGNDQSLIAAGNVALLHREQFQIIADDYDAMYAHAPTGPAMTYLMTLIGEPSIPGAHPYGDVFPVTITVETPGPKQIELPPIGPVRIGVDNPLQGTVTITTPFPDGNIANRDDRWALITNDTLPAYQAVLADPARANAIIASDVGGRIDDNRLLDRIDDILLQLTHWSVDLSQ